MNWRWCTLSLAILSLATSCRNDEAKTIIVDGSSTLYALAETAIVNLVAKHSVSLTMSGSGTGIERLCSGNASIALSSRPITALEERLCEDNGITMVILPIARDEVAFVVPRANLWLESLSLQQISAIWGSRTLERWSELDPAFPQSQIHRFAPGASSGTLVVAMRGLFGSSEENNPTRHLTNVMFEDDYMLATHLTRSNSGIGILPGVYANHFKSTLRKLEIQNPAANLRGLERILSIVVSRNDLERPEIRHVVQTLLNAERTYGAKLGYLPLSPSERQAQQKQLSLFFPNDEEVER